MKQLHLPRKRKAKKLIVASLGLGVSFVLGAHYMDRGLNSGRPQLSIQETELIPADGPASESVRSVTARAVVPLADARRVAIFVHTVDGESGAPITAAAIRWAPDDIAKATGLGMSRSAQIGARERASEYGSDSWQVQGITDKSGWLRIESFAVPSAVIATAPGLIGCVERMPVVDQIVFEIEMFRDGDLSVQVVTEMGIPVSSIQVLLQRKYAFSNVTVMKAISDDQMGIAVFRHARPIMIRAREARGADPSTFIAQQWTVSLDALLAQRVDMPIDPTLSASGPVRLVMPACGSMDVYIGGENRLNSDTEFPILLAVATPEFLVDPSQSEYAWLDDFELIPSAVISAPVRNGRATFLSVGIGLKCVAFAKWNSFSSANAVAIAGPKAAGEHTTAVVRVGDSAATIRGRSLGPMGRVMRNVKLRADLYSGLANVHFPPQGKAIGDWTSVRRGHFETDGDGVFQFNLSPEILRGGTPRLVLSSESAASRTLVAEPGIRNQLVSGFHGIGDVEFAPATLLVAGRLTDSAGNAVDGAVVSLLVPRERPRLTATSDLSGSFSLWKVGPVREIDLSVRKKGVGGAVVRHVEEGCVDLSIVLPRSSSISGELALQAIGGRHHLVRYRGAPDAAWSYARVQESGAFSCSGIDPGAYELEVITPGESMAAIHISGIEVGESLTTYLGRIELP